MNNPDVLREGIPSTLCSFEAFFPPLLHFPENEDESTVLYLNLMVTYLGLDPKVPGFRELLKAFPGNQSFAVPSFPFLRNNGFWSPTFGNLGTDTRKKPNQIMTQKPFRKIPNANHKIQLGIQADSRAKLVANPIKPHVP